MKEEDKSSKKHGKYEPGLLRYMDLGLQLAVTVIVMVFVGIWLDDEFNTKPYLTIIFSFLGIFAALYNFIKTVLKSDK